MNPEFIGDIERDIEWTISTLGCLLDKKEGYAKEPDCLDAIKELIRFLKKDRRETCPNRRTILTSGIITNDLVPILKFHFEDEELFDGTLRLLINLTQPATQCFAGSAAERANLDKVTTTLAKELLVSLQESKIHFADKQLMIVLSKRLKMFLEKEWENRREEERLTCERILLLIENVLTIPTSPEDAKRTDTDVTAQDQLVCAISESGLIDLFLFIGNSSDHSQFHLTILRIVAHMLEEHKPQDLTSAGQQRSGEEKRRDEAELAAIAAKEEAKEKAQRKIRSARHTRFAGSYTVQGVPALCPTNESVAHTVVKNPNRLGYLHDRKGRKKIPKNRAPIQTQDPYHRSQLTVRLLLRDFGIQFLDLAYNSIMKSVRRILNRADDMGENKSNGDVYYLWTIKFFTEFAVKLENKPLDRISETLDVESFHYCETRLESYMEMAKGDKRDAILWGAKARVAIGAFKALLQALQYMTIMPVYKECADKIKATIFYVAEYREITLNLFKKFNPAYLSRMFLTDLIEATGMYMRLLEKYSTEEGGFLVQKKRKKRKKRAKKDNNDENKRPRMDQTTRFTPERLDEIWETITADLCSCLQGHEDLPEDVVPFDAAMDVDDDTHKKVAMCRIQKALRGQRPGLSVALYRTSRRLWPEDDIFGAQEAEPEIEFMELREILIAELEEVNGSPNNSVTFARKLASLLEPGDQENYPEENDGGANPNGEPDGTEPGAVADTPFEAQEEGGGENFFADEEGSWDEEDEESERAEYVIKETLFEFRNYFKRFAKEDVIKCYVSLLENFEENGIGTNRWIVKFFNKVAFEQEMAPLLYQARLFRLLQKIGKNPAYKKMPHVTEVRDFGKALLKKFFEDVKTSGPRVFMEIFFWKQPKHAYEIQHAYDNTNAEGAEKITTASERLGWTEELEYEAEGLYQEYESMEEKPESVDVLDFIQSSLHKTFKRKQIRDLLRRRGYKVDLKKNKKKTVDVPSSPIIAEDDSF